MFRMKAIKEVLCDFVVVVVVAVVAVFVVVGVRFGVVGAGVRRWERGFE